MLGMVVTHYFFFSPLNQSSATHHIYLLLNNLVTLIVFQLEMSPYSFSAVARSSIHITTASLMFASLMALVSGQFPAIKWPSLQVEALHSDKPDRAVLTHDADDGRSEEQSPTPPALSSNTDALQGAAQLPGDRTPSRHVDSAQPSKSLRHVDSHSWVRELSAPLPTF
jgi:hypothetical protein